ncbi:signal peptidase I [bacterium]|nr:signal peptidase I [bacterium]MBU1071946.1 signal peptidase I [bacterium]MBU1675239.1 signal peptidase I [bacterium]
MRFGTRLAGWWRGWWPTLAVVLTVLTFRSAVADWYDVPTGSMQPTIYEGERIFCNKLAYGIKVPFSDWELARWDDPARGEIIVLDSPHDGTRLVKRIVAEAGDVVAMRGGVLLINGEPATYEPGAPPAWPLPPEFAGEHLYLTETVADMSHEVMMSLEQPIARDFGPVTVPAGHVFVSGDNRDHSFDSRFFGFVPVENVTGHVTAILASVDRDRHWRPRWGRFLTALH